MHQAHSHLPWSRPSDPALMRYVQGLEALFVDIRGRGVQWSPTDGELAARWYRAGVELATVARILSEASAAWRYRHGDAALPRSLSWIQKAVERATCGVPSARAHAADPIPLRSDAEVLRWLVDAGADVAASHSDPALRQATLRATRTMTRWLRQTDAAERDLLERLAVARKRLVKTALVGLGDGAAALVQAEAERRLPAGLGGRARAEALGHELANALDRAHRVPLPFLDGWRRPTLAQERVALIRPATRRHAEQHA